MNGQREQCARAVAFGAAVVVATALASVGSSGSGSAQASTGADSARASASPLADGKYDPTGDHAPASSSASAGTEDSKPGPTSDPDGAIEQWRREVGPTYVANEQKLDSINTWINRQPSFRDSGYLGVIEDARTFSITLLWRGSDALLESAEEYGKAVGAVVTVEQRPYSQSDLDVATAELWASRAALAAAGFQLARIVEVSDDADLPTITGVLNSPGTRSSVLNHIESLTGVKFTLSTAKQSNPDLSSFP